MNPQARKKGGMMFGGGAKKNAKVNRPETRHGKSAFFSETNVAKPKKFAAGGGPISSAMSSLASRTQGGPAPMGPGVPMGGMARTPTQGGPGSMGPATQMGGVARTPTQGGPGSMGPAVPMGGMARTPGPAQMSNLPPNMAALAGGLGNLGAAAPLPRGGVPNPSLMGMAPSGGAMSAMAKGGSVESKKMMQKEVSFMKKKGAPKSMIKHEEAEAKGMKSGGMACGGTKKYAGGGALPRSLKKPYIPSAGDINEKAGGDQEMKMREEIAERNRNRGPGRGPLSRNGMKDKPFGYARGGGVESHGKTKGTMVKMASGGSVSARADGVAQRGKTNCKIC